MTTSSTSDSQPALTKSASPAPRARRPGRLRRWLSPVRIGLLLVLLAVAGGLVWRNLRGAAVEVRTVARATLVERVVASGRVLAPAEVKLGSLVLGRVAEVHVVEGQRIAAGDLLVQLEDAEAQAAIVQAKATLDRARAGLAQVSRVGSRVAQERRKGAAARLAQAERSYERQQQLFESGAGARVELDAAKEALLLARTDHEAALAEAQSTGPGGAGYAVSYAALSEAEAGLELAETRLRQSRITAPSAGIILLREVEPGDVISPGETLLVLAREGATRLAVDVDEKNLSHLRLGQRGLASADAFPKETFPVKVVFIAPAVDAGRGTIEVKLEVPRPPKYLRPDMTVSVDIEVGRKDDVLLLPLEALRDGSSSEPWTLVVAGGRAARRPLQLGSRGSTAVEVIAGLQPGEQVIAQGSAAVEPGRRVRVTAVHAVDLSPDGG